MSERYITSRNFQNNKVDQDLSTIPGIGKGAIEKLKSNDITKTDHLIANFFMINRDEVAFIDFLESMGINCIFARECARAFVQKFGTL